MDILRGGLPPCQGLNSHLFDRFLCFAERQALGRLERSVSRPGRDSGDNSALLGILDFNRRLALGSNAGAYLDSLNGDI